MEIYKEDVLVLRFNNTNELNEPKVVRSVFNKMDLITKKAGFKRDFNDKEIELIRSVSETINSSVLTEEKP
jgi:hypothetical protein